MYGLYGHLVDDSRSYPSFLSSDDDRSYSGTISYPQTISKKKEIPIHLKKRHKRTKPAPLGLFLESIPSKCAKELNFHAKDLTETQDNDEESSNTALMSTSGVFLENPRQNIEEEFENHNDPKDYSKERTDYIKHNKEKMDFEYSLLLTDNLVPTNTSTNPFEDLFPSKNIMNSEMSTSLFDNHELRHTSTINQERSMELTEVSKELEDDTHELVQATLNANIKTNKPSILQDIKNYRDILNSKQKSEIKGTPKYIDKNLETNTVHKNSINHRLTNIDYLSSNTIGITPAKHNMNINNLSSSDTENNSKPVYQTPSIEKKVLRKCTPYNDTLSKGNFRKNKSNFYTPSCREDKENIDSLGSKTVSKLEVCKKEAHLKMKLVKELKEMTPAKQSFMDIKDHYMFSGGAEPKGKDSLDDDSGQGTLLNTIVVKEINILKRNEAYESHQVQQSEILSKIPETSLFSNQKNELSYVNMIVSTDADELKRYETNEFRHRQQSENHKKILQDKLTSNQKNGLSSALSGEVNFSNAPLVSRNGEKGHFKDTFDLRLKKSLDENQILYCKKEHYLSINGKNYEVQHLLGKGGSSKVFQVRDIETSQQLAVKVVDLSRAEKSIAEGYLNEITLLRRLQGYETVIKMIDYEYVEESEILYVAMEKGETDLSSLIRDISKTKQVPVSIIMHYWMEMLRAVKNIHANGIIHSDLKPANFLLVRGRLKLIDFGIACVQTEDMTSVHRDNPTGTFNYMSPEAIQRTSNSNGMNQIIKITHKSDIWSLGCILFNLLYGKTPFQHITHIALKLAAITDKNHRIEYPLTRKDCPAELKKALEQCLTHDPKMRPTATELLERPYFR